MSEPPPIQVGVSLKLYLDRDQTMGWAAAVATLASGRPSLRDGTVALWVAPSLPFLSLVKAELDGTLVGLAAQDLHWQDRGAYTGAVSGLDLAALGCSHVLVGHAERRTLFGDTARIVAAKLAAAVRNGLTPVLCVGEPEQGKDPRVAAEVCKRQIDMALNDLAQPAGTMIVAYEPIWAIGMSAPAPREYAAAVCEELRDHVGSISLDAQVVYGGSAGPGTLTALGSAVDGIFLGRFAHDPAALAAVLDEAERLAHGRGT